MQVNCSVEFSNRPPILSDDVQFPKDGLLVQRPWEVCLVFIPLFTDKADCKNELLNF